MLLWSVAVENIAALISCHSRASGGILPHLSLICSQSTYERGYKYISPLRSTPHQGGCWAIKQLASCILLHFPHFSSGGGETGQCAPPTSRGDREQVVASQRWSACALKPRALDRLEVNQCKKRKWWGHADTKLLISFIPWCNPPVVWVSGAETSIKTWRLSLNLLLALRRKQPQLEFVSFFSQTHACRLSPAGLCRPRDRPELVLHLGENQILVHFHQLSASDRYFCRAGQEIRLLNYSFSRGTRHFLLLSYRCSIKVSHCNHLSFRWLNTFFLSNPNAVSSFLLRSHLSVAPLLFSADMFE